MADIFEFDEYRRFIAAHLKALPNEGYGQLAKIARAISLNPSTLTLVLQGEKDFTLDQANDFCEYLGMAELETEAFILLVLLARAGKPNLKSRLLKQIQALRKKSNELKNRLPPKAELTEEAKSIFYSQWYYSGIRVLTSISEYRSVENISQRLRLPKSTVKQALDFLLRIGLCKEKAGKAQIGPLSTHLGADSPLVSRHHQNWRLKAIEKSDQISTNELMFTSPISIARGDIPRVKKILMAAVEECFKVIDSTTPEELVCLNIDWFKV
jgi:uncharacterized protein (TIGR02147 family)